MTIRHEIASVFGGKAFARPLFYEYPGGLRFELSNGEMSLIRFLSAIRTATKICEDIFEAEEAIAVCLRVTPETNCFAHRKVIAQLRGASIEFPRIREYWIEPAGLEQQCIAFEVPHPMLQNLLWCALARGFGSIRPRPYCSVYLFSMKRGVMVLPYDDRGMDVVGPNRMLLSRLYAAHEQHLLHHDRMTMDATFALPFPT